MKTNIGQRILVLWIILGAAVCAMPAVSHAATIYDDAIGYWAFDDGTADDSNASATQHDGTVYGATWTGTGKVGGAYSFDGTNDYIQVPNPGASDMYPTILGTDGSFTVGVWVKAQWPGYADQHVMVIDRYPAQFVLYHYDASTGSPDKLASYADGASAETQMWPEDFADNTWHYYNLVYDASIAANNLRIYRDGTLVAQGNGGNGLAATTEALTFGARNNGGSPYKGTLDEVALWDYALDVDAIDALYKTGYVSDAIANDPTLQALGYTSEEINQLADLYYLGISGQSPGSLTLDGMVWTYYDDLPGYSGQAEGAVYSIDQTTYLVLGSGLAGTGLGGNGAPEPATILSLLAAAAIAARKAMKRKTG